MSLEDGWNGGRPETSRLQVAGISLLRITLLFGSAAVALSLIAAPILEDQVTAYVDRSGGRAGLDTMSTGSIGARPKTTYTIRKSVLQTNPNSVCILRSNGTRSGDC